jgi:1-deoxy-D-xylulose-5-phosphate synthase
MPSNSILESLDSPKQLRDLSPQSLSVLCEEIRTRIIDTTSANGGHLGPNLGVVELTVALHLAFDSPRDSFCWDVSHQGYVHKLLTGRTDDKFEKLRNEGGYSGFLCREESVHDSYGAGHAGTALSAALGMCMARDMKSEDNHVVAIAGDAAFTCGITLEALNNIACSTKKFILVLNDNEWSIAKNVGAFSKYFNELIANPVYNKLHRDAESVLSSVPGGKSLMKFVSKAKRDTKELLAPSSIFEKLGIRYLGPIDGHDIDSLVHFLEFAKKSEEPIVLHILTQKGKGYPVALKEPEKWHGSGPFEKKTGVMKASPPGSPPKYQDVFGEVLSKLAKEDSRVVGITAAMPSGTGLDAFQENCPDRFFDVGIAEEHAVLLAAGMATKGMRPVCAIYSTFLQRAYDPIIHDVCLQNLPVTFCLDRAGLSPNDGPTHHGLFDISYLNCVPNAIIMQPRHEAELQNMLYTGVNSDQPAFIRYPRGNGLGVKVPEVAFNLEIGKAEVLESGELAAIWAIGDFVEVATQLNSRFLMEFGVGFTIVNARFIKPLDTHLLSNHAEDFDHIFTLEDGVLKGGFGSAILEYLSDTGGRSTITRFGWPDEFIPHGSSVSQLRKEFKLDEDSLYSAIYKKLQSLLKNKKLLAS